MLCFGNVSCRTITVYVPPPIGGKEYCVFFYFSGVVGLEENEEDLYWLTGNTKTAHWDGCFKKNAIKKNIHRSGVTMWHLLFTPSLKCLI